MKQFCRLVKAHTFLTCLVLAAALLVSIVIGIGSGPVAIPFAEVWRGMFHRLGGLLTGADKQKLDGVADGETKVEASTTAGNLKINGAATPVVQIATDTEVTEMIGEGFPAA